MIINTGLVAPSRWLNLALALLLALLLAINGAAPTAAAVRISVNDTPITDVQISQRVKLLQLEGKKSSLQSLAQKELIDEAIKMQEAKRLGITVSDAQVNDALTSVARNLRMSVDKLKGLLVDSGVAPSTLEDRLRASLAWNGVMQRAVSSRVQISEFELEQQAATKVTAATSFDYVLKEVIFVSTAGSASQRTAQANKYRSAFKGCDSAVQLSTGYVDAAVINVGRRHATQLPEAIAKELAGMNVGGITKPRVVENGVSMYAICSKAEARDLTFLTAELRQKAGNAALEKEAEAYLAELRAKARISR